jgi:hypothetical protein
MHELQAALCARELLWRSTKMEHWLGVALGERRISTPEHRHHRSCSRPQCLPYYGRVFTPRGVSRSVPHHSPLGRLSDFGNAVSNTGCNKLI